MYDISATRSTYQHPGKWAACKASPFHREPSNTLSHSLASVEALVSGMQGEKKQFGVPGQPTKVALQIYETLTAIQQLKSEDPFGWVFPVV